MTILVIAEHDNQRLNPLTCNAIAAARCIPRAIDAEIHVILAGYECAAAAAAAASIAGVARVRLAHARHYADHGAENLATLIARVVRDGAGAYTHVLAAGSAHGKNVMPRVAALLDVAQLSDIVAVKSADTFVRPLYAGNALATVQSFDTVKVATVRTAAFAPVPAKGGCATIEPLAPGPDLGLSSVRGRSENASKRPAIDGARIVVAGGRGLGSGENFRSLLEPLADRLSAALGASRPVVDTGEVPNDYQIGQTGKVVAPELYIAVGISGSIQHLAGMKDSKVIVAINKDAEAPIFEVADYGLVGDLFTIVPELVSAVS